MLEIAQDLLSGENVESSRKRFEDLPLIHQIAVIQIALRAGLLMQEVEELLRSYNLNQTDIDE
jgi:hypothetical protein